MDSVQKLAAFLGRHFGPPRLFLLVAAWILALGVWGMVARNFLPVEHRIQWPIPLELRAPLYAKFGLRNARMIYPAGAHLVDEARAIAREKVHRAAAALEWLARLAPELVQSEAGAPGLGVPRPVAEGVPG